MASTIMMQNMCNNQLNNDLGMFNGSQLNQVNYVSNYDSTSTPVRSELTGGVYMNQTLPMPMAYSPGCSPQMIPLGMPAISPPPMDFTTMGMPSVTPPLMNYDLQSVSPPPMAFVPTVPMMGYSVVPMQQGMTTTLVFPSASPENQMYLLPEMALTPPMGSISRSCSPVNMPVEHVEEVVRERLPSCGSNDSLDSSSVISKKELVENCLREIDEIFGNRVQTAGMRGPTVMRIKVKTRPALEKIVALLRSLEQNCNITAISCPKSTKKGKQHIRGFLAYIQTSTVHEIPQVQAVFDHFNRAHTVGEDSPFKTLEVNPQKKK